MILYLLITLTGFEYLMVDPVAERVGMGYALCGDGHNVHYNPAGIILNAGTSYSTSYMNYIGGTHFGHFDFENRFIGAGIKYFYSGKMKKTDALGQELGNFSTNFLDLNIGKGFAIHNILVGASGKIVYELIDTSYSFGLGVDIGGLYFLSQENIQIGITLKNLGISVKHFINEKERFPYEFNIGAVYRMTSGWLGLDIVRNAFMKFGIRLGAEFDLSKVFTLRASYNSLLSEIKTNTGLDFLSGISIGFGVRKGQIIINYSYIPFFSLGNAHRLTIRIGG